jgi:tRNA(Phe) wybutosine-synthesizing methylase Tyw3
MHETNEEILNELRIEVAKQKENIDSDYIEILKRIRDENYSKLKNKGGSKLIDKE